MMGLVVVDYLFATLFVSIFSIKIERVAYSLSFSLWMECVSLYVDPGPDVVVSCLT